jgi:hypothetical protein
VTNLNTQRNERLLAVVYSAMRSFNQQLPAQKRLPLSPDCEIVGSPNLDSADIVNLLVAIEQQVEQELAVSISLFGGETVEQGIESFKTVSAITEFLARKMPT